MNVKVVIGLTDDEVGLLSRSVNGRGGFESLLRKLQGQMQSTGHLELDVSDVKKIVQYTYKYGSGGFEGRTGAVLAALRRLSDALKFPA